MAKILVVDNSTDLLYLFPILLQPDGHKVESVSSNDAIKKALHTFLPDMIIMDIKLNGEDGRQLCKEIKEKHDRDIAIILMSASGKLLDDYKEWNADAAIEKPFDIHILNETINEVLNRYQYSSKNILK